VKKVQEYWVWGKEDPRVAGFCGYHYDTRTVYPQCPGLYSDGPCPTLYGHACCFKYGAGAYPRLNALLQQIGRSIMAGCDKAGMVIMTGRQTVGGTDWQVWEGAAPNHATLSIHAGEAPATALTNFHASATSWSERVNDQWNTAGIKDSDGYVSTL
jgi:hypothetical protein